MAESEKELRSLLMSMKEESEKAGLKPKTNIMVSSPIASWQIDGEKSGNSGRYFSWPPKSLWMMTAAMKLKDVCSLEGKL